jgi:hypothetical protein
MKCKDCLYRKDIRIKDDKAFDTEHGRYEYVDTDYCTNVYHQMPCDDAYLECEYRDITVEAQHIQHAINILTSAFSEIDHIGITNDTVYQLINTMNNTKAQLNKILKGEIE